MTVVSSKEFVSNRKKYFDLAVNEELCIKRGKKKFHLTCDTNEDELMHLAPDDDLRRGLSAEVFREKLIPILKEVDKKYANK